MGTSLKGMKELDPSVTFLLLIIHVAIVQPRSVLLQNSHSG